DQGADTVEANEQLGFPADMRRYDLCKPMLDHFNIASLRLMTNNPRKVDQLRAVGIDVVERLPLQVNRNPYNEGYLQTKAAKLGHWLKAPQTETDPCAAGTSCPTATSGTSMGW